MNGSLLGDRALPSLSPDELKRYSRHVILPEVGVEGQKRLKAASILIIGAGGLGSPLLMYLAAAGIGKLGIADFDVVDASNLQRQVIHFATDVGRPKTASAAEKVKAINPSCEVVVHEGPFKADVAMEIAKPYDIIIDGTDNFPTRYLANDVSVLLKKPNVYGSIFRFEGQASVFAPHLGGPCYRCLYPEPPPPGMVPSCAEGGVLGVLPGVVALIQATEALKLILGQGETLLGRLLLYDALGMTFRTLKLRRDPHCKLCGDHPSITQLIDYEQFCGIGPQEEAKAMKTITATELKARLDRGDKPFILDVREQFEYDICNIGARLIPLNTLPERFGELDPNQEIIVHCKMGGRSAKAVDFLAEHGFKNAVNLTGGIKAWIADVDSSLTDY